MVVCRIPLPCLGPVPGHAAAAVLTGHRTPGGGPRAVLLAGVKVMLENNAPTARCPVVVLNPFGLHMRPADRFAGLARRFAAEVRVYRDGLGVNGKSILDLATLAAGCGTRLELEARGPDAEAALAALAELVAARFHEADGGE